MSVSALLERLGHSKGLDVMQNSEEVTEALFSTLKKIQLVMEDAERAGATTASVRDWLKEMENVAYEIDDLLDEWEMEKQRTQLQGYDGAPWEMLCSFVINVCLCFRHMANSQVIIRKMHVLKIRTDDISEEVVHYKFRPHSEYVPPHMSTSILSETIVYGRNSDVRSILRMLVSEGSKDRETKTISIVGIGGVGKTTLAQLVYNHPTVQTNFELKAWVGAPNSFDILLVAKSILEAFDKTSTLSTLEALLRKIKEVVEDKRFLLVLDDVWTEDRSKWDLLKHVLHGAPGSRILTTTRSEWVARMISTTQLQRLGLLSDKDCASILNEIALKWRSPEERDKLREIGFEIAKKCNGLPLAAKNVGSMLALRSAEQWRDVLENPLWKHGDELDDLYRLLQMSYVDLSPVLKRCFLCCIVFPRDSLIHVDELIRIWMAYGYLSSYDAIDVLQSKGRMYFQNLAMRSFFQPVESDENDEWSLAFKIQGIMHDFAMYLSSNDYNFIMDEVIERDTNRWSDLERIRTFCASKVSQEELPLGHLERVRVLRLNECHLQMLPQEVGKLIHLRYLNLNDNPIRELPSTVSDLYNLQTLSIENCYKLCELPEGIRKLHNLRHLLNSGTEALTQYPQGLENLTSLWTLSEFRAGKASELGLLRNLNQLQGSLCIFLPRLNHLNEVWEANLKNKIHLLKLELFFEDEEQTTDAVDALQPPPKLQNLKVNGISSKWLSCWIDGTSFNHLKIVELNGHQKCRYLPLFGKLPILEKLFISDCALEFLEVEFFGIAIGVSEVEEACYFPKLKKLQFSSCYRWEIWEDISADEHSIRVMPHLEELTIDLCVSLDALPHNLLRQMKSLLCLRIISCRYLEERYEKNQGSNQDDISHIPHVIIS